MKTIFKYPIGILRYQVVNSFQGAKPVHVGFDPQGQPCIWMEVDTQNPPENFVVNVIGTGHDLPTLGAHAGSFLQGPFVWHVYFQPNTPQ
jgi:hypothetical protein